MADLLRRQPPRPHKIPETATTFQAQQYASTDVLTSGPMSELPQSKRDIIRKHTDVTPVKVDYLWDPYIPKGKFTLLEGDPGAGKSWVTAAIATALTLGRGLPLAHGNDLGPVLMLSAEDGLSDTIRPRLDSLHADQTMIFAVGDAHLTLDDEGMAILKSYIKQVKPILIVIDPLAAYFPANLNPNLSNNVRQFTTSLSKMAEHFDTAILGVRHLTKSDKSRAIYRGSGAIDWTAAARSVIMAGLDPQDDSKRALVHVKSNLKSFGPSIGYQLEPSTGFSWLGTTNLTAEQMLAPVDSEEKSALAEAKEFLLETLREGPILSRHVEEAAKAYDITMATLRRAKRELKVESKGQGKPGSKGIKEWYFMLPEQPKGGLDDHV